MTKIFASYFEQRCESCAPQAKYPGNVYAFPVRPETADSLRKKQNATAKYRKTIADHIFKNNYQKAATHATATPLNSPGPLSRQEKPTKVCLAIIFCLLPKDKDKDIDNMLKAFLDAIKGSGGLINDDMEVVHLAAHKVINHAQFTVNVPTGSKSPSAAFQSCKTLICARVVHAQEQLEM